MSECKCELKGELSTFVDSLSGGLEGLDTIQGTLGAETNLDGVLSSQVISKDDIATIGSKAEGEGYITPIVIKESTDIKATDITTVVPEGQHYIAIKTLEEHREVTITPVIVTEGYATIEHYNPVESVVHTGVNESAIHYIGIESGDIALTNELECENPVVTILTTTESSEPMIIDLSGISSKPPEEGSYISLESSTQEVTTTITSTVVSDVTEGYVTESDGKNVVTTKDITIASAKSTQYIKLYEGEYS